MKKIILILLLFVYSGTFANVIEYDKPKFDEINQFLTNSDIEPGYNPQPNKRIWVFSDYIVDGVDLLTAEKFCNILWLNYTNHILENTLSNKMSVLYYPDNNTWWNYNQDIYKYSTITCNNNTTGTGTIETSSTTEIVINNINQDPWINKEVFDEATLIEIYKYEAVIMVFIIFYTFLMRVIWKRPKKTKPFDF